MRQTLARLFDLALITQPQNVQPCRIWEARGGNIWGRTSSKYVSLFARGAFGIVRVGGFPSGASQLGQNYSIRQFISIYDPTKSTINDITAKFRAVLTEIAGY
jgi:hypothetical protein